MVTMVICQNRKQMLIFNYFNINIYIYIKVNKKQSSEIDFDHFDFDHFDQKSYQSQKIICIFSIKRAHRLWMY